MSRFDHDFRGKAVAASAQETEPGTWNPTLLVAVAGVVGLATGIIIDIVCGTDIKAAAMSCAMIHRWLVNSEERREAQKSTAQPKSRRTPNLP